MIGSLSLACRQKLFSVPLWASLVLVWGMIDDDQNPNWQNVFYFKYTSAGPMFGGAPFATVPFSGEMGDTNDPSITWTDVDDNQTASWAAITTPTGSWSNIDDAQTPDWDIIDTKQPCS